MLWQRTCPAAAHSSSNVPAVCVSCLLCRGVHAEGRAPARAEVLSAGRGAAPGSHRSGAHASSRSDASGSSSLARSGSVQSGALPALPWSDWEIDPRDIHICKRDDGSDWKLGTGAYGTVRLAAGCVPG